MAFSILKVKCDTLYNGGFCFTQSSFCEVFQMSFSSSSTCEVGLFNKGSCLDTPFGMEKVIAFHLVTLLSCLSST